MPQGILEENTDDEKAIVKPILKTQDAVTELRMFEEMKGKLLSGADYQMISGKQFIKKSGWRKLALVFNISDEVIESSKTVKEEGSFVWTFRVRARAPNGRYTEAVASCDSKERKFTHLEHDVQATAHTRAKSRAISDLIGAGETSAEEMDADIEDDTSGVQDELRAESFLRNASDLMRKSHNAKPERNVGGMYPRLDESQNEHRFDFTLERQPFPVKESEPPFSRFFLNKICKGITDKNPRSRYELVRNDSQEITAIVWHGIDETQRKEIENTLAWSLRKVSEKRAASKPDPM